MGAAYAIHSADQGLFNQAIVNGKATLNFPYPFPANIAQPGSQFFQQAGAIHFIDPVVYQWNVTGERDLGFDTAIQLSYTGMHGANLGVQGDLNQLPLNNVSPLLFGIVCDVMDQKAIGPYDIPCRTACAPCANQI